MVVRVDEDAVGTAEALAEVGPLPTVTTLENTPRYNESVADTFGPLARTTPNLAKLVLRGRPTLEEIAMLQAWFPQLAELVFVHWPNDKLEIQRYYADVHALGVTWMTLAEADACSG